MPKPIFALPVLSAIMCLALNINDAIADQAQTQFGWRGSCRGGGSCTHASRQQPAMQPRAQNREAIYGSQLMTRQERAEYRAKMRSLRTKEEREAFRMEHHQKMQERATAKGKMLLDMPPAKGSGMGSGGKMGGDPNR
ncbi:MAG TPA: hypothetical protein VFQ99_00180 [Gallionella sp.]|nr:hypothetical protein [Gallionella sp.]